jgi:hypothetical protein
MASIIQKKALLKFGIVFGGFYDIQSQEGTNRQFCYRLT